MRNPFKRQPRQPVTVQLSPLAVTHTVKHEYGVRPKPTYATITWTNNRGGRYVQPAFSIYPGMSDIRFSSIPLSFITGQDGDAAFQIDAQLHIDFG